jgi:ABC-2 type transport system permease protein
MKRVFADLKAYGKQFLRSKIGTFFTFGFPILLILLFGAIFSGAEDLTITLHIQDEDDSVMSKTFIEIMNSTGVLNIEYIPKDADIEEFISDNSLTVALHIPEGFQENLSMYNRSNLPPGIVFNVTLYGEQSQTTYSIAQAVVAGSINGLNDAQFQNAKALGMQTASVTPQEFEYIDFFLPGVVGFTVMATPMFAMASICTEYRTRGYFKLLGSTPLTKSEWLTSKVFWFLFVIFLSFALMLAVGIAAFGLKVTLTLEAVAIVMVGTILFTSLGMLIGSVTKNPETSAAIANAIMFPMMFLSGTFFPLESMPAYLQSVASVMPLTYINNGLRDTMIFGNANSALINLGVVIIIALIFFILASKFMSWKKK